MTNADDTAAAPETWTKTPDYRFLARGGRRLEPTGLWSLRVNGKEIAHNLLEADADAILRLKDEAREAQQLRRGSLQAMLIEFHAAFGLTTNLGKPPAITDESPLRRELLREEYEEYIAAEDAGDLVELADALGDMAYVIYGTAIAYGIDLDAVVREIHRSNMTKLMPDGTVKRREDGKVQKGPNFVRPNINAALEASTTTQAGET